MYSARLASDISETDSAEFLCRNLCDASSHPHQNGERLHRMSRSPGDRATRRELRSGQGHPRATIETLDDRLRVYRTYPFRILTELFSRVLLPRSSRLDNPLEQSVFDHDTCGGDSVSSSCCSSHYTNTRRSAQGEYLLQIVESELSLSILLEFSLPRPSYSADL